MRRLNQLVMRNVLMRQRVRNETEQATASASTA